MCPCNKLVLAGTLGSSNAVAQIPIAPQVPQTAAIRYGARLFSKNADVKGAIINGQTDQTGNLSAVSAVCGSGNYTFTEYASSGMCQSCLDVTSLISELVYNPSSGGSKSSKLYSNLTLPSGLSICNGPSYQPNIWLNISSDPSVAWAKITDPIMLAGLPASIYNFTLLQITDMNCTITVDSTMSNSEETFYNYHCPQQSQELDFRLEQLRSPGYHMYFVSLRQKLRVPC